jgi:hypothetical protein
MKAGLARFCRIVITGEGGWSGKRKAPSTILDARFSPA